MKEKSPFENTTIHIRTISKAAGEFKAITGRDAILAFQDCPEGKIRLCVAEGDLSNIVYMSDPIPNWKAYELLLDSVAHYRKDAAFAIPAPEKPVPLALEPITKEKFFTLMSRLSHDVVNRLIELFRDEIDYLEAENDFKPDEIMRADLDAARRYNYVFETHGHWSHAKAPTNARVLLKRYRMFVMQALKKAYADGEKVIPEKHDRFLAL